QRAALTSLAAAMLSATVSFMARSDMMGLVHATGEEAAWAKDKHRQEGEMAGEDLPFRVDRCPRRLRDTDDDAAGQRAPKAAEPADDHRLERKDEARRADRRTEVRANAEEGAGER